MKAEDVQCSPNTVKKYTEILEALFVVFRVTPYHTNIARSLLKEPKFYFYDTGMVKGDEGVRFENLVTVSLLKYVNAIEDYRGKRATLNYLRVLPRPHLSIFTKKNYLPALQVVHHLRQEQMDGAIEIRRVLNFLQKLKL